MNLKYTEVANIITLNEGITGSAVWGAGPYAAARFYSSEANKENDPIKKKQLLYKARQLRSMAIGGAVGGMLPLGTIIGGPIGANIGYEIGRPKE
jgi:hypothetical protein